MRRQAKFSLLALSALLALLTAASAEAAVRYKAVTSSGGEGQKNESQMIVEGYVEGDNAKVFFRESDNPWMKSGFYLVTTDGGRTVYIVDPSNETYSEWDLELILRFAGSIMEGMGPLLNFEINNSKVELVSEAPGGTLHGLPTQRFEYKTEYDMLMKILGMKRAQHIESHSQIWTTDALSHGALGLWLRKDPPKIGFEEFDKLADSAWQRLEGRVVLKFEETSTTTTKKGKTSNTWSKFEVTEVDTSAGDPPGGYGWPDHYTQTQMMPSEAELSGQESGDDGKKKKKRFGGLFDGRR